ncbi:hypothetical protein GO001_02675 [Streptomyces sp. NRRL B-1677]|uniref:Cupin n=1 Tax=Streptomyces klenkii TaxID=1420899 RepID=A0A3B0BAP4_9ACTN|nr:MULTISPECIES: hypothetical protein [Streptomyces]MBF6044128.1 hypothetical protein [Streptomyces sp. NRRL B-1677]RKN70433.1 hypothetical protein D7231_21475 [Streptomyces klenkii]
MTGSLTCVSGAEAGTRPLSELALFVRTHRGRGPGLLWPEHAGPDDWDRPPGALAVLLALHLGCPVGELPGLPVEPSAGMSAAPYDLLVLQQAGSSGWRLRPPDRPAAEAAGPELRLRAGEVLYVPAGYAAGVRPGRGARDVRLALGPYADA